MREFHPMSEEVGAVRSDSKQFGMKKWPPPSKCPDCGGKLGPIYYRQVLGPHFRECGCGVRMEWNGTKEWQRRHILPLFDAPRDAKGVLIKCDAD